jgi:hypothetical protein
MSRGGFAPHLCAWCGRNEATVTVNLGTVPPATEDICEQCYTEVYITEPQRPRPEAGPQIREIAGRMEKAALLAEYDLWQGAYDTLAALRDGGPLRVFRA